MMTSDCTVGSSRRVLLRASWACALLLIASCSSPSSPTQYLPEPAALQSAVDCSTATGWEIAATEPAMLLKGRVPDGFAPTEVVSCTPGEMHGEVTREHLSGDYAPLLAALAKPSERGGNASCLDYGEILPAIWLINADGQAVNAQWPMDNCSHSLPGTFEALKALTPTDSETIPVQGAAS
ncbi:hypothetical protein ACT3TS_00020 [Specibacter sp. AOP5-B1-6]|uniref:hypothetical protein n=1 Tax=Specibacter sp. AOP5-B1-6 TaxID=3457653 RepID=UPI00402BDBB1